MHKKCSTVFFLLEIIMDLEFCLHQGPHGECYEWLPLTNQLEIMFPNVGFEEADIGPHGEDGFIVTNYMGCKCIDQIIDYMKENNYKKMSISNEDAIYFSKW